MPRTKNDEKHRQMKAMWDAGKTREEIAKEFNYKLSSISGTLNKMGISFMRDYTKEHETILQMNHDGKTLKEITEAVGMCEGTIRTYLKRNGVHNDKTIDRGYEKTVVDESNLTYAPPKQIKKVVDNGKRYDDVTEMLFQQYEG